MSLARENISIAYLVAALSLSSGVARAQDTATYTYDALGRLKQVVTTNTLDPATSDYSYDKAGNRTGVTIVTAGPRVLNGDFELPTMTTFAYAPLAPSLAFAGGAGVARNGSSWGFATPWSGNQVGFVQASGNNNGYIELSAVDLVIGKHYAVAFASARRPGFPANNLKIYVNGTLLWNGPPVTDAYFTVNYAQSFQALATTATIRLESTATSYDSSSAIDAVSVAQLD